VDARTNDIKLVTSLLSNQVHQVINCDKTTVPQFDKEDQKKSLKKSRDNNNRLNTREETASAPTEAIAARNIERPVPVGCRRIQIGDKQACSACQNACTLSIDRLLNPRAALL
jgi:hypothetical protein